MTEMHVEIEARSVERMFDRALAWLNPNQLAGFTRGTFNDIMRESVIERFATESSSGQPWQPLNQRTILRRLAMGVPPGPINVRSGEMRAFLVNSVPHGGPFGDGVEFMWPDEPNTDMTEKLEAAAGKKAGTPARPVIDVDEEDVTQFIDEAFLDFERFMR